MGATTFSRRDRKAELVCAGLISCPICRVHRSENRGGRYPNRSWKRYRRAQYKPVAK